ncbi:MAG TPA: hypothetical protein VE177_02110, partial [Candidatus Binatus sp.]|nr:hypothetical protein [Candidatus Binatus sp.]
DQRLIEIARDICRQLGYPLNPEVISWRDRMGIRTLPPDHFLMFRNEIQLSARATGQLTPEEWRPIFASGLTYYKIFQRAYLRGLLTTMVPLVLLLPVVLLLDFQYLNGTLLYIPIILGMIALTIVMGVRLIMISKKAWYTADIRAARLVGKDQLIASLKKLDQIDMARAGKRRRGLSRPSPSERVERLAQFATTAMS